MKTTTAVILLLLSIALFYTFTSPQYGKLKKLQAEQKEYQEVLGQIEAIASLRDSHLHSLESIPVEERERLEKALPDSFDAIRLAYDLNTIAARHGISISKVATSVQENNADGAIADEALRLYSSGIVTIHFSSSYENFKKFLVDVEKSLHIADIRELSFTSPDEGLYEFKMSIETYWLK